MFIDINLIWKHILRVYLTNIYIRWVSTCIFQRQWVYIRERIKLALFSLNLVCISNFYITFQRFTPDVYAITLCRSFSIERWFLPPMKPKEKQPFFSSFFPRRIKWLHIRNNWTSVSFLLLFCIFNVTLFASRACHYWNTNIYVILARACGKSIFLNFVGEIH